jgi:hypothetical protein
LKKENPEKAIMSNKHLRNSEHTPEDRSAEDLEEIIVEHLKWQNQVEYELSDSYDVKTSIALVVILFLAAQSAGFLGSQMPLHWHYWQIASVIFLIISGVLSVIELIPRTYRVGLSPNEFQQWIDEVKSFYGAQAASDPNVRTVEFVRRKQIDQMRERFIENSSKNASKSALIQWIFLSMVISLAINLLTLTALMTRWRF